MVKAEKQCNRTRDLTPGSLTSKNPQISQVPAMPRGPPGLSHQTNIFLKITLSQGVPIVFCYIPTTTQPSVVTCFLKIKFGEKGLSYISGWLSRGQTRVCSAFCFKEQITPDAHLRPCSTVAPCLRVTFAKWTL